MFCFSAITSYLSGTITACQADLLISFNTWPFGLPHTVASMRATRGGHSPSGRGLDIADIWTGNELIVRCSRRHIFYETLIGDEISARTAIHAETTTSHCGCHCVYICTQINKRLLLSGVAEAQRSAHAPKAGEQQNNNLVSDVRRKLEINVRSECAPLLQRNSVIVGESILAKKKQKAKRPWCDANSQVPVECRAVTASQTASAIATNVRHGINKTYRKTHQIKRQTPMNTGFFFVEPLT